MVLAGGLIKNPAACRRNGTTGGTTGTLGRARKSLSERRDLNSGPLAPHASALPDCATFRSRNYTRLARLMLKGLEAFDQRVELFADGILARGALVPHAEGVA